MYFWCIYLVWLLEAWVFGMFFSTVLSVRWKNINKLILIMIAVLCCIIPAYFKLKYSYDSNSPEYQINNIAQMISLITYVCVFFKDKFWKKVLAFVLMIIASVFASIISQFVSVATGVKLDLLTWNLNTFLIYFVVFISLLFFYAFFVLICKKIMNVGYEIKNIFLMIIFPVAQFFISYDTINLTDENMFYINIFSCISFILVMITDLILFYILMNQSEKEYLENQLKKREKLRAIETVRYEELEAKRVEMAKFRHDYNNQLTTALLLEEQGNAEMAKEMIAKLKEQVRE